MYLCYIDESGTPDVPGNTSHYVLAGLSIPIWEWKRCDSEIFDLKRKYGLEGAEIHVAWILRPYLEQRAIPNFESLDYAQRRSHVIRLRTAEILRLQRSNNITQYRQTRKNHKKTDAYIHLTHDERRNLIKDLALCVSRWSFARLFAECVDKVFFDPSRWPLSVDEQTFQQVVSRFEHHLRIVGTRQGANWGLLVHDNNPTVAKKHTDLMKSFHDKGTGWTSVQHIIETPLFVDSALTSMVQISDLCCYAIRRYLENKEEELFDLIFQRADRKNGIVVGVRHFTEMTCHCKICDSHRMPKRSRWRLRRRRSKGAETTSAKNS